MSRKFEFLLNLTKITIIKNACEYLRIFMIPYRLILLRMPNISDERCRQNQTRI